MAKPFRPRGKNDRRLWRRRAVVEQLEPRLLLSADLPGASLEEALPSPYAPADAAEIVEAVAMRDVGHRASEQHVSPRELVFVDAGVEDYQKLVEDLLSRGVEVRVLDAERDGIAQIGEVLSTHAHDLDAVHVLSHGTDQGVQLGDTWLTSESLPDQAESLAAWRGALTGSADLLLYGCDLAGSSEGQALVDALATLTGADVAASTDLTGAAALGGDWDLEYATGSVETAVAFSPRLQDSFASVLEIALDPSSNGSTPDQASVTVSHTTSGANRLMLVGVSTDPHGDSVSSITYNGVDLSFVGAEERPGAHSRVEIWGLVAPDTGTHDVIVDITGSSHRGVTVGVTTFTGVNQTTPLLAFSSASGRSTVASTTVASATDDRVFGVVHSHFGTDAVPGAGQTEQWDVVADQSNGSGTVEGGAASVDTWWTVNDEDWSVAAVSVQADTNFAEVASLSPVQDAYIQLKNPDTNQGTSASMVVDRETTDLQRALVQFDLSSIPPGSTIQSATLRLEATNVGGDLNIEAYQVLESWVEGSTTWNERSSGTAWGTVGGSFNATALDSLAVANGDEGPQVFDITTLAQGWVDGSQQNHGVLVASPDGGGDRTATYDSREGPVAPVLEIVYTPLNDDPTADAGGPYNIAEGDPVTLDASSSADLDGDSLTYAWDIDGDLTYGDETGVSPNLSWDQLKGYGIDDDGAHTVSVRVDDGKGGFDTASATINVANTAPTLTVSGPDNVDEDAVYTLTLSATDPGDETRSWTINWGDGTIDTVGDVPSATHVYTQSGFTRNITISVTDEDGTYAPGNVFLSSNNTDSLFRLDGTTGGLLEEFADLDGFTNPVDVEIGPDGLIYATGFASNDVRRYDPVTGTFLGPFVAPGSGGLSAPSRMAFGPDGHLYVTSYNTDEVLRFDGATGAFIDEFVTAGSGALNRPDAISFGPDGNLYVSSNFNGRILRYDGSSGGFIDTFANIGSTGYTDLTFGPDGNLYVSNVSLNKVQRFDGATGAKIDDFVAAGSGGISGAAGLLFGPDNYLYVVGFTSDNVLRYSASDGGFFDEFIKPVAGQIQPINLAFAPAQQVLVNHRADTPTVTAAVTDEDTQTSSGLVIDRNASDGVEVTHFKITNITNGTLYQNDGSTVINNGDFITFAEGNVGLRFTPTLDYTGPASFDVQASTTGDDIDLSAAATASITVTDVNHTPVAGHDSASTNEDTMIVIDVLANDIDPDGDPIEVLDLTQPAHGNAIVNPDNTITYTPDPDYSGSDSFDYVITDQTSGMTHYWKLDGDATDSLGSNYGTVFGTSTVQGFYGDALSFDQVDDHVVIPDFSYASDFTVAFAFKVDDISGNAFQYLYSHGALETPNSLNILIGETGSMFPGTLLTSIQDSNDFPLSIALNADISGLIGDGQWHVYTLTVASGAGSEVFIDGVSRASSARGDDGINPGTSLYLGARQDLFPDRFYGGSLDSVMVFGQALSPQEAVALTPGSLGRATVDTTIIPVNDAPSGTDTTVTTLEDTAYTFQTSDFGFSDPVEGDNLQGVKITTVPGTGILRNGATVLIGGETVSAADIGLGNLTYTPPGDANGAALASFTFQVQDTGGTADGGVDLDPTANTLTIDVTAVNDAPAGTDTTVTTLEDTAYTFQTSDFGFSDPVEGDNLQGVKITTVPGTGILRNGATVLIGGETVSAADIGLGNLTYTPPGDANGAALASFTFQVQDDGGSPGVDLDPTANTLTIDVTAVNDAPSGTDTTVTTLEDTAYTFQTSDFGFSDPVEGDNLQGVKITTVPGTGILRNGATVLIGGETVSAADIGLGNLTYTPPGDANGAALASFTFQVQDDGGSPGVDLDPTANTLTIDVTAVNDAPAGTDGTVTTSEDTAYTFTALDFGFSDPVEGDNLQGVKITTVPGTGILRNGATVLIGGETVSAADIGLGNLTYTPPGDANGAALASFTFQVQDTGGTADGGVDLDPTANTLTIDVTAVNDAPAGTDTTVTTLEDTAYTFQTSDFGFSDPVEGDNLQGVKITTVPGTGILRNGATVLIGGETVSAADIGLGNLTYTPPGDANGAALASFTFQVQDDGGSPGVDLDPTANTLTIDVTAVNDAPAGTDTTVTTLEDTAYTFQTSDFGFSDPVEGDNLQGVKITTVPGTGILRNGATVLIGGETVSAADIGLGNLTYTPPGDANGAALASFTFQVQDDGGSPGVDLDPTANTLTIDVTAVNDAPAGTDGTVTTLEDTAYTFTALDFGFSDPVEGDNLQGVKITTVPGTGILRNGATVLIGGETVSAADIGLGNLTYTPPGDANGAALASFTFQVQDTGGTADGGVDLDPTANTLTIDVTAVNDAPAGTDGTVTTLEDTAYTFTALDFGFSDPVEGDNLQGVKITTVPGTGILRNGATVLIGGETVSAADIGLGNLTYTPPGDANGAALASFTFQVQDDGGSPGVDLDPTANTLTIDVTAVNDAPAGTDGTVTTLEDTAYTFTALDFGFSDPVEGDNLQGVKITTVPGTGILRNGATVLIGGETVSAADIGLGNLTYTPPGDANGAALASFTFQVQDTGGTADGGVDLDPTANTLTIDVTAVNDAPAGTDGTVTTLEDTAYTFTALDFGFSDPVEGDNLQGVKITTVPGTGILRNGATVLIGGETVSAVDIGLGNLTYTPPGDANGAALASFTFQVQDTGGTADGGVDLDLTANTLTIDVTAVNDAPAGTDGTVTTSEDTAYTFTALDFGFSDPVEGDNLQGVKITTVPGTGILRNGATVLIGGETVSAADIGLGNLTYTPPGDANGAALASFTFQVQDTGGTADGGVDLDPTANTLTIDVTAVNDAPAGTDGTVTTSEDTAYTFTALDFGFSDPVEGDNLQGVKITTVPGTGILRNGATVLIGGETVSAVDIGLGNLTYTPPGDANGAALASFTFQVQDDGGSPGVDLDPTANTLTIDVTAVNDAPAGTDGTVTTLEDTAYTFTALDFGFSDPVEGDNLQGVKITTVPGTGILRNGATVLIGGETVSAVDIGLGNLTYTPPGDANGAALASFTFQVQDTGGTADGGVDLDLTANTLTIDVTAVNDAPAGTDGTVTTSEDTAYTFTALDFGFSDPVEGDNLQGVKITTVPGTGILRNGATVLIGGETVSAADIGLGNLTYTPPGDANGAALASFTFQVQDDGGSPGVDLDPTANTLTIDVTAVNDAPSATDTAFSLAENSANGTVVGTVSASDVDTGDTLSYAITAGDPGGAFAIDAATGEITVADSAQLDFETTPPFNLTVTVTDAGGLTDTAAVMVSLIDVNDAPTASDAAFLMPENSPGGTVVGPVSASDPDPGDKLSYAITGGDPGGAFAIDATTGEITVDDSSKLDFETTPVFDLTVTVTDAGGLTDTALVTVNLTGVEEAPVLNPAAPTLPSITEDDTDNAGERVSSILGASITDSDAAALQGIAITSLVPGNGSWEYSTDSGAGWNAMGTVSGNSALLLRATDKVRFVPDGENADAASFSYRAWDQTSGTAGVKVDTNLNGGNTAFSSATDTASISVTAVNDAPGLGNAKLAGAAADAPSPSGETVLKLFARLVSDVDAESGLGGIAVVGNGADPGTEGVWQYSTDGGASWFAIGPVGDDATALALSADTLVRFVPVGHFSGSPSVLVVRALDDTYAGGFSSSSGGAQDRVNVDTASSGGTSAIAGSTATVSTSITAAAPPDLDLPPDPVPDPLPEEIPPIDETTEPLPVEIGEPEVSVVPAAAVRIVSPAPLETFSVDLSLESAFEQHERADASLTPGAAIQVVQRILEERFSITPGSPLADLIFEGTDFLGDLDRLHDDLENFVSYETTVVGSSIALTMGLSIGYVIWLTRGGLLLASLLSSLPAWRLIDPIAVLAYLGPDEEEDRDDEESLDSLLSRSSRPEGSRLWRPEPRTAGEHRSDSLATGGEEFPPENDPAQRGAK